MKVLIGERKNQRWQLFWYQVQWGMKFEAKSRQTEILKCINRLILLLVEPEN